jgi:hypothetical protein
MRVDDLATLSINPSMPESEIMIQKAFNAIYNQGINEAFPLHEACRCNRELHNAFKKFNITPSIKTENMLEQ